jgi:hypothetical protein
MTYSEQVLRRKGEKFCEKDYEIGYFKELEHIDATMCLLHNEQAIFMV